MPSLAYARDLSRLAMAFATCGGVPCTEIPNCTQAQSCVSSCGPGVLQNCAGGKGKIPIISDALNNLEGATQGAGDSVAKGAGNVGRGFHDAIQSTEDAFKSSLGALTAPCGWAKKVPGINQVPCWIAYMIIVLGLVVVVTKVR